MKIVALGEVMMRLETRDYKKLSQTNTLKMLFSGTGVNVLSGLYQMGEDVYLTSTLPENTIGDAAAAQIRKLGIHDEFLYYHGNHIGVYILEPGFGNRRTQVTYLNRKESSFGLSKLEDYALEEIIRGMDALHLCGISLALNSHTRNIALRAAEIAQLLGVQVIFDCNFRSQLWDERDLDQVKVVYEQILHLSNIVFAGSKDAELLLGIKNNKPNLSGWDKIENLLLQMKERYKIDVIVGTKRAVEDEKHFIQGYILQEQKLVYSEKYHVYVYDRVGGGDAFAAGAIHKILHKKPAQEIVTFATVSGMLAHTTYGDSPILRKSEIEDFIEFGSEDIKR